MTSILSLENARAIQLAALGLLSPTNKKAKKNDVLQAIRNMSVLQIDTIHVINRSPFLVLYSRIGSFDQEWIPELLSERNLFEYWSHEACFLPIEDSPLYNSMIHSRKARAFHWSKEWIKANKKDAVRVFNHVQQNGATMSSHFINTLKTRGGWWNWKVEKMALDMLYTQGKLTIIGRKNFQRIYDLTERAIPQELYNSKIPLSRVYETFIERTVKHLGVTKKSWVHDYFRLKKSVAYPVFEKLLKKNLFIEVNVEGFDESLYFHKENTNLVESALAGKVIPTHVAFLSPFDPLVWDRKRVKELFNFDYQIESYTPSRKRKYGYFTLPILYKGQLIGRMDAKAHRNENIFEVKSIHFEESFTPDKVCLQKLTVELVKFALWHNTSTIKITSIFPIRYKNG